VDLGRPIIAAGRAHGGPAATVDHALLVAAQAARQAGTRTARVAARLDTPRARRPQADHPLVSAMLAGDPAAAATLGGSFHPQVARTAASTSVKPGFTLAF
jgi:hypothetical protein